jgi:hypothetical protein
MKSAAIAVLSIYIIYIFNDSVSMSQDNSIGIGTGYRLNGRYSVTGRCNRFFYILQRPDRLKAHCVSYLMVAGDDFPEAKQPGCEADHLLSSRRKQEWWNRITTPPKVFLAQCLINQAQRQFYHYFRLHDVQQWNY